MSTSCFFAVAGLVLVSALAIGMGEARADAQDAAEAQRYRDALRDLHVSKQFVAGKNAFVLGLEKHAQRPMLVSEPGERMTLLDVEGQGSLRHIWETHGPGEPRFAYAFYVDGETEPSVHGKLEHIVAAAKQVEQPFTPRGGSVVPEDSYNLYLPVPFERSLRVEAVVIRPIEEPTGVTFLQLDYRTDDDALAGVRLVQEGDGEDLALRYEGHVEAEPAVDTPELETRAAEGRLELAGPAVVRRLAVDAAPRGARLRVYFDGEASAAVDADVADFFGPFRGTVLDDNQSYFPMPFRESAVIEVVDAHDPVRIEADVEHVEAFEADWRYFHAKSAEAYETDGAEPFEILHTHGRGHWLGMSLYESGMDHGGGDFAIIDGVGEAPQFLHGINGEDYFSFAYFGQGRNLPYSEAFDNDTGRMRVHLENPYPFEQSLHLTFGVLAGERPRAVTYWYQDDAVDRTLTRQAGRGLKWQVFGPVEAPVLDDGNTPDTDSAETLFAPLPSPETLDAGEPVPVSHLIFRRRFEADYQGWAEQWDIGSHLNLTYAYGHVMDLGHNAHISAYPRLMMARTTLHARQPGSVTLQLSYDDPIEVLLNDEQVYVDLDLHDGFVTRNAEVELAEGENTLLLRLLDTPNTTMAWAGVSVRVLDDAGILDNADRP